MRVISAVGRNWLIVFVVVWLAWPGQILIWPGQIAVWGEAAESKPVAAVPREHILISSATLARLRSAAASKTAQWREFEKKLDDNLAVVLNEGTYQGSALRWVSEYALGYLILKDREPVTAAQYADKAIAMIKSGLCDYQQGSGAARQFLVRGDGKTRQFTLPHDDVLNASCHVYLGEITTRAVTRSATADADAVDYYRCYLKVSNSPDGATDYLEGEDWRRNGDLPNNMLDWSGAKRKPAPGATYYVTSTSLIEANRAVCKILGRLVVLKTAPKADEALLVQYVRGWRRLPGTLMYQQTSSGGGGFNSILVDGGYSGRYLGKHIATGIDWLDGYPGLTPELKQEAMGLLVRWSDHLPDKGYRTAYPASNYGAGSYVSRVFTALALADRHPDGPRLVQELLAYREQKVCPTLEGPAPSLRGGFWAEGWGYGEMAAENLILAGLALEQRGLVKEATAERRWAGEVIRNMVSAQSSPDTIYDAGDWYSYPAKTPSKTLFSVLSTAAVEPADRSYANYLLQKYPGRPEADSLDLLYRDPSAPAAFWSNLPLQNFADGTGLLTARSDWGTTPTWVALQMGNLLMADHQSYSPGQLQIRHGSDDLLINGNAPGKHQGHPSTKSTFGNLVLIDDGGEGVQNYRWGMGVWYGEPGVRWLASEYTQDYVYAAGDYRAAYSSNSQPGAGGPARELTRQAVYRRPNFVFVHDRVQTTKPGYAKQQRWHFLRPPELSKNSFRAVSGASQLFGSAFGSVPIATTVSEVKSGDAKVHQVITQNSSPTDAVRYTTVFEVAGAKTPAMSATQQVLDQEAGVEGAQIGATVVLFGAAGPVDGRRNIQYRAVGADSIQHILVDLPAKQTYRIAVNGQAAGQAAVSGNGVLNFTTAGRGEQTIVLQPGGMEP